MNRNAHEESRLQRIKNLAITRRHLLPTGLGVTADVATYRGEKPLRKGKKNSNINKYNIYK